MIVPKLPGISDFISYLNRYAPIGPDIEKELLELTLIEEVPKDHLFLEEGTTSQRLYFIVKGTVRTYFYRDGKDVTHWIYAEQSLVTSWPSYVLRKPSREYVEATEKSTAISLSYDQWQSLYHKYPILERAGRRIMEESMAQLDDFYQGYYSLSAREKFELLTSVFPDVTLRANLGHIASFLGISQETLSRIRSKSQE